MHCGKGQGIMLQRLEDVTEREWKAVEELYGARAERVARIPRLLREEFRMALSSTLVQRIILRLPEDLKKKRKAIQGARRAKTMAEIRAKERAEGRGENRGRGRCKNPDVAPYSPERHGIPLWHGDRLHNQWVVKKCPVCGRLFHPYAGWERKEVYCSFICQEKD